VAFSIMELRSGTILSISINFPKMDAKNPGAN
jgi:hypothetical protein